MTLSGKVLARCLLLIAMIDCTIAQNATTPAPANNTTTTTATQPYGYVYGYPVQPNPMQPPSAQRPMQYRAQPIMFKPVQPASNATWPTYPYYYYPYQQQPANEYSQVMNIYPNPNQYAQPQYYLVPIANQSATK